MKTLYQFHQDLANVTVMIQSQADAYIVKIRDDEISEYLPVRTFGKLEDALYYARRCLVF